MALQVNFETQVMKNSRWTISNRYESYEQEKAIEDAKVLYKSKVGEVRVLREVLDTETSSTRDSIIYDSSSGGVVPDAAPTSNKPADKPPSFSKENSPAKDVAAKPAEDIKPKIEKPAKPPSSFVEVVVKLLIILLLSVALGATTAIVCREYIEGMEVFGTVLIGTAHYKTLIYVFLFASFVTFLTLASVLLGGTTIKKKPTQMAVVESSEQPKPKKKMRDHHPLS